MRNFSQVSNQNIFVTAVANGEYFYGDEPQKTLTRVLSALAEAFETPLERVIRAMDQVIAEKSGKLPDFDEILIAPSEYAVLVDLISVLIPAQKVWDDVPSSDRQPALMFKYINLNTGVSVSWVILDL